MTRPAAIFALIVLLSSAAAAALPLHTDVLVTSQDGVQVWSRPDGGLQVVTDAELVSPAYQSRHAAGTQKLFMVGAGTRVLKLVRNGATVRIDLPAGVGTSANLPSRLFEVVPPGAAGAYMDAGHHLSKF